MSAKKSTAQRLGRVLETVTRQSGRLPETPAYGSWLLGRVSESQRRRRVRIQVMLTALVVTANLLGIGVALLLVTIAIPEPSIVRDTPRWLTFGVVPGYVLLALALGSYALTRQTVQALRWAIEGRKPTREEERRTFLAPWRVAVGHLMFWGVGTALLTTLYGLINNAFIPRFLFAVSFAAYWSQPQPICIPSSHCARSPPRRSRPGRRHAGWRRESWAGPWWCGCSVREYPSSASP